MFSDASSLPWKIQVALASGYAAYVIAYTGIRRHHTSIEISFKTLLFGLISVATLELTKLWTPITSGALAVFCSLVAALVWRTVGLRAYTASLRTLDVSLSDEQPTAWSSLINAPNVELTQIAVELQNGDWLRCDSLSQFVKCPAGPAILGETGDIALYLTHTECGPHGEKSLSTVKSDEFGDRMTYIPAAQVKQVTVRMKATVSRFSRVVAYFRSFRPAWKAALNRLHRRHLEP